MQLHARCGHTTTHNSPLQVQPLGHTVPTLSQAQSHPLSPRTHRSHSVTSTIPPSVNLSHSNAHAHLYAHTNSMPRRSLCCAAGLGAMRVCVCVRRYVGLVGTKGEKRCGIELDTPDVRSSPPLPSLLLSSPPESEFGRCSGAVRLVFVTGLSLHAQFLGQNG